MTDQEIVLRAFTELRKIAAEYIIEPDPHEAEITMQQMLSILDRRDVARQQSAYPKIWLVGGQIG